MGDRLAHTMGGGGGGHWVPTGCSLLVFVGVLLLS